MAAGLVVAVVSGLIAFAALWAALRGEVEKGGAWGVALLFLLFAAMAGYGATLVVRGLRGTSAVGERLSRLDRWLPRNLNLAWMALGAGAGAVVFVSTGGHAPAASWLKPQLPLWYWLVAMLLLPACIAIHEVGHALAGRAAGITVSALRVGPLVLGRAEDGCTRVTWDASDMGVALGAAYPSPFREAPHPWQVGIFGAGGPILSGLAALGCYWAARSIAETPAGATGAGALLWAACFANLYCLASSVLPFRLPGGVATDATQLLSLALPSPAGRLAWRLDLQPSARRPSQWGVTVDELVQAAGADPQTRPKLLLYALAVALDGGDLLRAEPVLRLALDLIATMSPTLANEFQLQAVMVDALLRGAPAPARKRLDHLERQPTANFYPLLAEAAVLAAEERLVEAKEALARWVAGAAATGHGARAAIGNQWALDLLESRLARSSAGAGGPATAGPEATGQG